MHRASTTFAGLLGFHCCAVILGMFRSLGAYSSTTNLYFPLSVGFVGKKVAHIWRHDEGAMR